MKYCIKISVFSCHNLRSGCQDLAGSQDQTCPADAIILPAPLVFPAGARLPLFCGRLSGFSPAFRRGSPFLGPSLWPAESSDRQPDRDCLAPARYLTPGAALERAALELAHDLVNFSLLSWGPFRCSCLTLAAAFAFLPGHLRLPP